VAESETPRQGPDHSGLGAAFVRKNGFVSGNAAHDPFVILCNSHLRAETAHRAAAGMRCRLWPRARVRYHGLMPNMKYNKRRLELVRSADSRLKRLPSLIRKELRAGSDRQLNALRKLERTIELVAREMKYQRDLLEKTVDG
jgi:hypothetical protein